MSSASPADPGASAPRLRFKDRLLLVLVPPLAKALVSFLGFTGSYPRPRGGENFPDCRARGPSILVFWHSRTLMHLHLYRNLDIHGFVSRSRDGELLARTLAWFGYGVVRGSSSRGGFAGMRGLLKALKSGKDVGLAPDGPRGPAEQVQKGVVVLAQLSGQPIRPVAWSASKAWRARSWDRFVIPKPWAKGAVLWGPPIHVPRDLDEKSLEEYRVRIQKGLDSVTLEADSRTGFNP